MNRVAGTIGAAHAITRLLELDRRHSLARSPYRLRRVLSRCRCSAVIVVSTTYFYGAYRKKLRKVKKCEVTLPFSTYGMMCQLEVISFRRCFKCRSAPMYQLV